MSTAERARTRVTGLAAAVALVLVGAVVNAPAARAMSAPSHFRATEIAGQAIALTWDKRGDDAYRVRMSTHSDMSDPQTWDVLGNYVEWAALDPNPDQSSPRLKPGKTYYFQVKAIERKAGDRGNLSSYSSRLAVRTSTKAYPELKPIDLKATPATTGMYLSWRSRGPGVRYLLRYSTNSSTSVTRWQKTTFDVAGGFLAGLKADTRYYFRVRVVDSEGKPLSSYSTTWKATTRTTSPAINVLTYNVNKVSNTSHPWEARRDAVAANIRAQAPDVIGLQEASPLLVTGADGTQVTQYDDLVQRLGPGYALATRRGSSGTKLAYNTTRLSVVEADAAALTTFGSVTRYAVWAVFKDNRNGREFFVLNAHLEPGSDTVPEYNLARGTQASEILQLVSQHSRGLPVVVQGDFNSARTASPENVPYMVFTRAGLVDPMGNTEASWAAARNATAEHLIGAEYNSYNGYETRARRTSFPAGTYIDYIFTDPRIRVAQLRTVVDVDRKGDFVGMVPSDHNAMVATVELP